MVEWHHRISKMFKKKQTKNKDWGRCFFFFFFFFLQFRFSCVPLCDLDTETPDNYVIRQRI